MDKVHGFIVLKEIVTNVLLTPNLILDEVAAKEIEDQARTESETFIFNVIGGKAVIPKSDVLIAFLADKPMTLKEAKDRMNEILDKWREKKRADKDEEVRE